MELKLTFSWSSLSSTVHNCIGGLRQQLRLAKQTTTMTTITTPIETQTPIVIVKECELCWLSTCIGFLTPASKNKYVNVVKNKIWPNWSKLLIAFVLFGKQLTLKALKTVNNINETTFMAIFPSETLPIL